MKARISFLLVLLIWQCCIAGYIIFNSLLYDDKQSDVAIVLGAAIWGDQPSLVFEQRIIHAINLYKRGRVNKILFTGGIGAGEKYAESVVAFNYAILNGVSSVDILIETQSKTTLENLIEAKKLLDVRNLNSALLVSDPLHMLRAMTVAKSLGVNVRTSPTQTSRYKTLLPQLKFLLREIYFLQRYYFFGY